MTASPELVGELKAQVLLLEHDLRARVEGQPDVLPQWQDEHRRATEANRTANSWVAWRDDRVTQAAVAWVLTTVFIRFCEDNALLGPVWIAGPTERRQEALDAQLAYFRAHPTDTDREWLMQAINYLAATPATKSLVESHSMLWAVSPSGQAVTKLIDFWRERDEDGTLRRDFTDPQLSTRFLGDLYQDLSEHAKKTYALLQTPEFVEEFILDQTLEPALKERPLEGFKLIDPACGSGHFLLGAFRRLLDRWERYAPALEGRVRVQEALQAVCGVDLNPAAIAISRFRLTLAALTACGEGSLEHAPAFSLHVEAGDSLLFGHTQEEIAFSDTVEMAGFSYTSENREALNGLLAWGQYDVVVGNPPYITVKDRALRSNYKERYRSCHREYSLSVPFMELFFRLAKHEGGGNPAGWTGQITASSFMKQAFGEKLIKDFLVTKDLTQVIDVEGAWIPGHNMDGTPTVILIGRERGPSNPMVRVVLSMGARETRSSGMNGRGPYWRSILTNLAKPGYEDEWIKVSDLPRKDLVSHPWVLTGGAGEALASRLDSESIATLGNVASDIGYTGQTNADDVFLHPAGTLQRHGVATEFIREFLTGSDLRDFEIERGAAALFPYDTEGRLLEWPISGAVTKWLWPFRTTLGNRATFGGSTYAAENRPWWAWHQVAKSRLEGPGITWAVVSSVNHFSYLDSLYLHNRHAPVLRLSQDATREEYLAVLTVLTSSIACFWLRRAARPKGGAAEIPWLRTFEFTGKILQRFPLPKTQPQTKGAHLEKLVERLKHVSPVEVCSRQLPTFAAMTMAENKSNMLHAQMVATQEEIDWEVYHHYGIVAEDLTFCDSDPPPVLLGERAFEIALARNLAGNAYASWFASSGSTPVTEIPDHWPAAYRALVQRRLDLIASDRFIGLLEKPEYKRRWASEPWAVRQKRAVREWLLDRLEDRAFWHDRQGRAKPQSISELADLVARDSDLMSVIALWEGRPDVPLVDSLTRLLIDEAVPYLAAYRLKESGLRKREAWEETWALQRQEDAGTLRQAQGSGQQAKGSGQGDGTLRQAQGTVAIPVPPKYSGADFRNQSWGQVRGKLDVPKERFILYPDAGRSTDPTLLLGWAGWDHAQQALALATIISAREDEGAGDAVLVPLVAGLAELLPWVEQWHSEVDPAFGVSMAAFFREELATRAQQVNHSLDQLRQWRPAAKTRGRKARS